MRLPSSFFISGTDTDVGKTVVAAVLMMGLDATYWKPVQSGCIDGSDREWVQHTSGLPSERFAGDLSVDQLKRASFVPDLLDILDHLWRASHSVVAPARIDVDEARLSGLQTGGPGSDSLHQPPVL